ncbi:hypothetical protein D3C84_1245040 [compost metagenome]
MTVSPSFDDNAMVKAHLSNPDVPQAERLSRMIAQLPEQAWEQIVKAKRYDALFELAPGQTGEQS